MRTDKISQGLRAATRRLPRHAAPQSVSRIGRAGKLRLTFARLGLRDFIDFEAQSHTPANRCVRFAIAVTGNYATLATRRPATTLPVLVFHRLERASFS